MANDVFVSGNGEGSNEEGSVTELRARKSGGFTKRTSKHGNHLSDMTL